MKEREAMIADVRARRQEIQLQLERQRAFEAEVAAQAQRQAAAAPRNAKPRWRPGHSEPTPVAAPNDAAFAASIVLRRRTSGQLGPRRAPPFLAKKCFHALFQSRLFALSSRD